MAQPPRPRPPVDRKARLRIPPQKIRKQDPNVRVLNWSEVYLPLDIETAKVEAERCIQCPAAPCQVACPVHNDIPGALWLLEQGDPNAAADVFHETSTMPEMCGRLCPQERLCEGHCVVGKNNKPVAIGRLEAFVADWKRHKAPETPLRAAATGRRVAVVGAGPAGLTVAEDLARLGHAVTVFDAWPAAGGVLRYGIPDFKLEKRVLDEKLDVLRHLGVAFVQDTYVGRGAATGVDDLLCAGYDAVFLAHGASAGNPLAIEGAGLNGVIQATEFLSRGNLPPEQLPAPMREPLHVGRRVVIIGGGDTSMDCARTAVRLGAREVTLVYRRTEREMVGREEERQHAREEGVRFEFLASPVRFLGTAAGRVRAVQLERMELGPPDESGRRRPQPVPASEFTLEADTVVLAIGYSVDERAVASAPGVLTDKYGVVLVDRETGATDRPGVYAGGDCINGADLVVTAIRDAKIAARAMHAYLTSLGAPKAAVEPSAAAGA
ncbi:MAG TPA: NAD(P)-dependent oxidoreductase [Dehalococcoidia bacterium]|nr:NAD(P)-dependent oxidoreductase [Dehalococcoidia bacterium]